MSAHKEHKRNPGHDFVFLDPCSLILAQIRQPREPDLKDPGGITETHTYQTHKLEVLLIIKAATEEKQRWREDNKVKNSMDAMVTKALTVLRGGKLLYRRLIT